MNVWGNGEMYVCTEGVHTEYMHAFGIPSTKDCRVPNSWVIPKEDRTDKLHAA